MATTAPDLAPATRRGGPDWWQNFWSRAERKTCRFLPKFNLEEKSWATWSWRKAVSGWLPTASGDLPRGLLRDFDPAVSRVADGFAATAYGQNAACCGN